MRRKCDVLGERASGPGYSTQFNLDSDRAFAYLTWDWIRNEPIPGKLGASPAFPNLNFATPIIPPAGAPGWNPDNALQLKYKDPPESHKPPPPPPIH